MIQLKIIFIVLFCMAQFAYGKTYYSEVDKAAVIYFMPDETTVNALYCSDIDKSTARQVARNARASQGYDQTMCERISNEGVSQTSLETKIPEIKQRIIEAYAAFNEAIGNMAKVFTGDPQVGETVENLFSQLTDQQKANVEQINAESAFSVFVTEAISPVIESVDSKQLNEEVETFIMLSQ